MKNIKVKFGIGRSWWSWDKKQIFILPCLGVIKGRLFVDEKEIRRITINLSWILWGAYISFEKRIGLCEEDDAE